MGIQASLRVPRLISRACKPAVTIILATARLESEITGEVNPLVSSSYYWITY
jgi:hypothetical protein